MIGDKESKVANLYSFGLRDSYNGKIQLRLEDFGGGDGNNSESTY